MIFDFEANDVWMIASYDSHLTEQDMHVYRKRLRVSPVNHSCQSLLPSHEIPSSALGVYTFTEVDRAGCFFGCVIVTAMKRRLESDTQIFGEVMAK